MYGVYNYDLTGQNLKGIPEHKAVVWANYSISLPNDSRMNLAAYYSYTGEYNTNSIDRAFDTLPARHQTDVSAIWTNVDVFVDNLFDSKLQILGYRLTGSMIRDRNFGIDVTAVRGYLKPKTARIKKPLLEGLFCMTVNKNAM